MPMPPAEAAVCVQVSIDLVGLTLLTMLVLGLRPAWFEQAQTLLFPKKEAGGTLLFCLHACMPLCKEMPQY